MSQPAGQPDGWEDAWENEDGPRVVFIPVDDSGRMRVALEWFMANMNRATDRVVMAHVFEIRQRDLADKIYERVDVLCDSLGIADRVTFVERQSAGTGQTLVDIARDIRASMVLMASRGLGGAGRFILGSVSDYIVRHVRLPIVVIPPGAAPSRLVYAMPQSARTSTKSLV